MRPLVMIGALLWGVQSAFILQSCSGRGTTSTSADGGPDAALLDASHVDAAHTDGALCTDPLDEETLNRLTLTFFPGVVQLTPGQSHAFQIGVVECCYTFEPIDACATWSVEPTQGAEITQDGVLSIAPDVVNGTVYTVRADVENGRRILTAEVWIYTHEANPFVGTYREVAQFDCQNGAEFVPTETIGELMFMANGEFALTWWPFEVYVDYWGTYTYDLQTGAFAIAITGGNYIPSDVDGQGTFLFDTNGDLLLHDLYLGSASGSSDPPGCGHRFQ